MEWSKEFINLAQYEYASTNQHGDRFKKICSKQIPVVVLTAECNEASDLRELILFSHHLNLPVHYDFKTTPQTAYIRLVGRESLSGL